MKIAAFVLLLGVSAPSFAQGFLETQKHDLRDGKFDFGVLKYAGPTPEKFITHEKEGLRLRFFGIEVGPKQNNVGATWRFHARGDFAVSAKYEILKQTRQKRGNGIGAELYLRLANPMKEGIVLARLLPTFGDPVILLTYNTTRPNGERGSKFYRRFPTDDDSLRGGFRLAREGGFLIASMAKGGGEFAELDRFPIADSDIEVIRMAGQGCDDPTAVLDMRITDFQLQGKDLAINGKGFVTPPPVQFPNPDNVNDRPPMEPNGPAKATPARGFWLLGLLFLLLPFVLLIAFAVYYLRRKRAAASGQPDESSLAFACSACGKSLTAKSTLAGKNVKCPQCGQAVLVPGNGQSQ